MAKEKKITKKELFRKAIENGIELRDPQRYKWIYNQEEGRVYLLAAEWEFVLDGIDPMENGYPASSLLEAIKIVKEQ